MMIYEEYVPRRAEWIRELYLKDCEKRNLK